MADEKISDLTELTSGSMAPASDLLEAAISGDNRKIKPASLLGRTPSQETGSSYTFALSDAFLTKTFNSASAQVATIPPNSSVAFPIGTRIRLMRLGTGTVKFVPDTGVTLRLPTGIVPARTMGVHASMSANMSSGNPTSGREIPFGAEVYDTDGFHDTTTNNGRLTIPANLGIKKVQITAQAYGLGITQSAYSHITLWKNGALDTEVGSLYVGGGYIPNLSKNGMTACIPCDASDYFQIYYYSSDTSNQATTDWTAFSLTVTEIDAQGWIAYQYGSVEIQKIGTDEWIVIDQSALG
jgi:hypothetical protein